MPADIGSRSALLKTSEPQCRPEPRAPDMIYADHGGSTDLRILPGDILIDSPEGRRAGPGAKCLQHLPSVLFTVRD
jgi:hypothetical protein